MQWIDLKYIGALAPRLSMFAKKDNDVWNMRCPICGDSQKSKSKARGYILGKSGRYTYTCHNCNVSMSFSRFLETIQLRIRITSVKQLKKGFLLGRRQIFKQEQVLKSLIPNSLNLNTQRCIKNTH